MIDPSLCAKNELIIYQLVAINLLTEFSPWLRPFNLSRMRS